MWCDFPLLYAQKKDSMNPEERRTVIGDDLDTVILPYTHAAVLEVKSGEHRQGQRRTSRSCRGQYRWRRRKDQNQPFLEGARTRRRRGRRKEPEGRGECKVDEIWFLLSQHRHSPSDRARFKPGHGFLSPPHTSSYHTARSLSYIYISLRRLRKEVALTRRLDCISGAES